MVPVASLESLVYQEHKVVKGLVETKDLEDLKEIMEILDLRVTLEIVNVFK